MSPQDNVVQGKDDFITFCSLVTKYDSQHGADPILIFQSLPEKGQDGLTARHYFGCPVSQLERAWMMLRKDNLGGYSANFALNEIGVNGDISCGRKRNGVSRIRGFVVDVDHALPLTVIEKVVSLMSPTIVVASSRSGKAKAWVYRVHLYWLIGYGTGYTGLQMDETQQADFETDLITSWRLIQQMFACKVEDVTRDAARELGVSLSGFVTDKQVRNLAGTMRLPGFLHAKVGSAVYRSRIIHLHEEAITPPPRLELFLRGFGFGAAYGREVRGRVSEHRKLAVEGKGEGKESVHRENDESKLVTRYVGASEGARNMTMLDYVRELVCIRGLGREEAIGCAVWEDERKNKPPMGSDAVVGMVGRVWDDYVANLSEKLRRRIAKGDSIAARSTILNGLKDSLSLLPAADRNFKYDYSDSISFTSLQSDVAIAERVMQRNTGRLVLYPVGKKGELRGYDERTGLWDVEKVGEGLVYSWIRDVLADVVVEPGVVASFCDARGNLEEKRYSSFKDSLFSASRHQAVCSVLRNTPRLRVDAQLFNASANLLHCANGVLDLDSLELGAWRSDLYQSVSCGVSWIGDADKVTRLGEMSGRAMRRLSLWGSFIWDVCGGDESMMRYLQKIVGYAMYGANDRELMFFFWGSGDNGKSVYIETVLALLGGYSFSVPVSLFTAERSSTNKDSIIAQLPGMRVISTSEVGKDRVWDEEIIKSMTGGDKINARALYSRSFSYRPGFKTFVRGNHRPIIRGSDDGIWRRIRLVPFEVKIPAAKKDVELRAKLTRRESLEEILVWGVAGWRLYCSEGLDAPARALAVAAEYRAEMCPLEDFIRECFDVVPGDEIEAGEAEGREAGISVNQALAVYNAWRIAAGGMHERMTALELRKVLGEMNLHTRGSRVEGEMSVRLLPLKVRRAWREVGKDGAMSKLVGM